MTKRDELERAEAIANLRKLVKPGDTVWTVLRHVSGSGMSRVIDVVVIARIDGRSTLRRIGWLCAKAMDYRYDSERNGVKSSGAGMDMGFELAYNLGRTLRPKGVRKGYRGAPETDGGYALRHEWL